MWIDYIQLLEGAIPPTCPELVFDINRDLVIDEDDMATFFYYATGPADANGSWASLPPDCKCMDVNKDNSLDMEDFAILQRSPGISWCTSVNLLNGDFEGGNTGGVATGWTGYTRGDNTRVVYTIQMSAPAEGIQYQQIQTSYYPVGSGAGVYQVVTGCTIGVTYRIQGWFRTNSAHGRATVKCDPYGGTSYSSAINLTPAAATIAKYWVRFSGTVTAQAPTITLFLDGETYIYDEGSLGKAAAFDGVVVTCTIPP
jgi:hypothetical protein